ncbi:MAG: ion channel, partial [Tepidisphaeraceae bacterium]
MGMRYGLRRHRDVLLLLSLLMLIVVYPSLDHGTARRIILSFLILLTLIQATAQVSRKRHRLWSSVVLLCGMAVFTVAFLITSKPGFAAVQWAISAVLFASMASGLFAYLKDARDITAGHLYTAASIYLLLAMLWFAIYCAIDAMYPGSFQYTGRGAVDRHSELMYFSLVTLTTVGYGDIVAVAGVVRMLAAIEAAVGVLYIA